MEVIHKFDLSKDGDRYDYHFVKQANKLYNVIHEMASHLEYEKGHQSRNYSDDELNVIQEIKDKLFKLIQEEGVELL